MEGEGRLLGRVGERVDATTTTPSGGSQQADRSRTTDSGYEEIERLKDEVSWLQGENRMLAKAVYQ